MQPESPSPLDVASIEELARRVVEQLGERSHLDDFAVVDAARSPVASTSTWWVTPSTAAPRPGRRARLRLDLRVVTEALARLEDHLATMSVVAALELHGPELDVVSEREMRVDRGISTVCSHTSSATRRSGPSCRLAARSTASRPRKPRGGRSSLRIQFEPVLLG